MVKGCKVLSTKNEGKDLVVTFDAKGNGITAEEFAPKLLGKTTSGKLLFGYARLPWVSYNDPILSARMPIVSPDSQDMNVVVENFRSGGIQTCCPETGIITGWKQERSGTGKVVFSESLW